MKPLNYRPDEKENDIETLKNIASKLSNVLNSRSAAKRANKKYYRNIHMTALHKDLYEFLKETGNIVQASKALAAYVRKNNVRIII